MTVEAVRQLSVSANAPACRHYWLVAPQGAPTSLATCKRCGAQREFLNGAEACQDEKKRRSPFSRTPRSAVTD